MQKGRQVLGKSKLSRSKPGRKYEPCSASFTGGAGEAVSESREKQPPIIGKAGYGPCSCTTSFD